MTNGIDPDLEWLMKHLPAPDAPDLHDERVERVAALVNQSIRNDRLPVTIGLFGGWGSGKTTLLAKLTQSARASGWRSYKLVYFNAWKYAGFMEIVPSLIYKVLRFGNYDHVRVGPEQIAEIMTSLGKDYADKIGEWVEKYVAVNPTKLIADAKQIADAFKNGSRTVRQNVIDAYYGQIDRAQDLLLDVFKDPKKVTIVLIDELDRCDPDEAFSVIKQLRILFAMRKLPIVFVVCANPDPIGQAIKHRHGLESKTGDFEARRILEKFVDFYIDLSEPMNIGKLVEWLWREQTQQTGNLKDVQLGDAATLIGLDTEFLTNNTVFPTNETALAVMTTEIPMYGNLRLLKKSLEYVSARRFPNEEFIWSGWHMEIISQMEPALQSELSVIANDIATVACVAHQRVFDIEMVWTRGRFVPSSAEFKDFSIFGLYRSFFWEEALRRLGRTQNPVNPQNKAEQDILQKWLANVPHMNFLIILTLLPLRIASAGHKFREGDSLPRPKVTFSELGPRLGAQLASY
jgi:hypothetical protein